MTGREPARLVVMASGRGTNLQAILDAVADGRLAARVVLVVSDVPGAGAVDRARRAGVPVAVVEPAPRRPGEDRLAARRRYDARLAPVVAAARPDWVVMVGWMRICSSVFLDRFPGRVINLHPALPGRFPGAHAIDDAWAAHEAGGLDHTGVMVHLVPDERVDEGPVLAERVVEILPGDTRAALERRIHEAEHALIVEVLDDLVAERSVPGVTGPGGGPVVDRRRPRGRGGARLDS